MSAESGRAVDIQYRRNPCDQLYSIECVLGSSQMVKSTSRKYSMRQVLNIHRNFLRQFCHVATALMERDDLAGVVCNCLRGRCGLVRHALPAVQAALPKQDRHAPPMQKNRRCLSHCQAIYQLRMRRKKSGSVPDIALAGHLLVFEPCDVLSITMLWQTQPYLQAHHGNNAYGLPQGADGNLEVMRMKAKGLHAPDYVVNLDSI
jgi:hypothetical protein